MKEDFILSDKIKIGDEQKTFVIAEIGQNHQGDFNTAVEMIKSAKWAGAHCVKFQKTCLNEKFTREALDAIYDNPNSWGHTYGEHKQHLEFTEEQFKMLQLVAHENDILFSATPMDLISLNFLCDMGLPFIKIGSGDSNNFILIEEAAKKYVPLIVSTGMAGIELVKQIYATISKYHNKFILLHCVSAYPTPLDELNLRVIKLYKKLFPDIHIGYSGHEQGIDISLAAVGLGAKILERHFTLNRAQKGSDHLVSLEPAEFKELVHKTRRLEIALGKPLKSFQQSETACYVKLGKTIVTAKDLKQGHVIRLEDMKIKVARPRGIDAAEFKNVIGKRLNKDINVDNPITENDVIE